MMLGLVGSCYCCVYAQFSLLLSVHNAVSVQPLICLLKWDEWFSSCSRVACAILDDRNLRNPCADELGCSECVVLRCRWVIAARPPIKGLCFRMMRAHHRGAQWPTPRK